MTGTWKNCPFCNARAVFDGVRVQEEVLNDQSAKIYAECLTCGARGPSMVTDLYKAAKDKVALAKAGWNRREGV